MTDSLAAEARRLRTVERLSARQIQTRLGVGKDRLYELLRGVPPPEWTRRPNAKDDLRAQAVVLRGKGWSVVDIALVLGVAKSTAYQWVKHLPLDVDSEAQRERRQAHSKRNDRCSMGGASGGAGCRARRRPRLRRTGSARFAIAN